MVYERVGIREIDVELQKLRQVLAEGKNRKIDLVQFMQDCTLLFDKVEICSKEGEAREKELVFRKLAEWGASIDSDIMDLCLRFGKTEEEISAYLENPDNYSPDVWSAIQKAQRKIISTKKRKHRGV